MFRTGKRGLYVENIARNTEKAFLATARVPGLGFRIHTSRVQAFRV